MRTRSQPMSPSGYLALDNDRPTRTRSKKKATPESSIERSIEPPTEPSSSSHRVTRSQGKKPDGIEQEPSAESEISDSAEATRPKSTPASPQKKVASKKTSRRTGKAKASASDPTPQQNVESVVINQNATTENEGQETRRSPRKGKAKSKATSQHPVNPPVSRVTRSQSRQPDSMEDNATTNGEEPKHSRRPRRTRAASRTTPQPLDGTPTLRPDHADQTAVSEDEPLATTDRNGPNAVNKEITGFEEAQAEGKENLSPSECPWNIPLPDSPRPESPQPENQPPSPLWPIGVWEGEESPLSSRSQTPTEPEWEDLPAPAIGDELVLDCSLLEELTAALSLHDEQEAKLVADAGFPVGQVAQEPSPKEQPEEEGDNLGESGAIGSPMALEESAAGSPEVDHLADLVAALALHDGQAEPNDLVMSDAADEAPASPIDFEMDDAEPLPALGMPVFEEAPVADNDLEMGDAMPIEIVAPCAIPRVEINSTLQSFGPACPVACLDRAPSAPTNYPFGLVPRAVWLTTLELTRKRRRDDDPEPTTPKRRNLGPPAAFSERPRRQVPFLTRGPFRPLPLAERERRRRAERSGRLHSTLFHLPEYVSQAGAEHKEQETRPVPLQHSEPATHPDEPRTEPESTPVTPQRGWSIRGLLNSMPRPFSRFIPSLGSLASRPNSLDAPEGGAVPASEISEASEPPAATTPHEVLEPPAAEAPEVSAPARQSSETGTVHQPDDPSFPEGDSLLSEADLRYRKRLEEFEKNVKREMIGDYELTYSLFPRPWDTRRWLESSKHTSKTASPKVPSKTTPKSLSKASPKPTANATPKSTSKVAQNHSTNIAPKTALQTTPQPQKAKKRKRAPSPDVIPNPPGCSYGMDLEYFYIDESEEDEEIVTPSHEAPKGTSAAPKSAIRSADQSIQPPSKKVRFDASPQDSPSKIRSRARATEPYTGRHFIGMGEGPAQTDRMDAHPPAVASAATSHQTAAQPSHTPTSAGTAPFPGPHTALGPPNGLGLPTTPGFPTAPGLPAASGLPATPGVLATPDLSTGPAPIPVSTPTQATTTTTQAITPPTQAVTTPAQAITTPTQVTATPTQATTTPIQAPTTPTQATTTSANDQDLSARVTALPAGPSQLEAPPITDKPEDEVVAKARSQVEKFKPKTPSALRTTSRYSSPLTTSPDLFSNLRPSLDFGDDQAGRDAQWLYEICPSGKMEELKWPTKQKVTDSLDIDNRSRQLLVKTWNNLEVDDNHSLFCNMMEESE